LSDDPHPNNNKDSTTQYAHCLNSQPSTAGDGSSQLFSPSVLIVIAAKVSFRLTKQSTGGTYCQPLLHQPMDSDLELLFAMLLVVLDSNCSDGHVWPKGTFLQFNTRPTVIKQHYHEKVLNKWIKYNC
jgi:hypothetical protein